MIYGIVYRITNTVNGKCYVGQTIRGTQRRFKQHCSADSYIGKAIRRYGTSAFRIEEIASCLDRDALNRAEIELIRAYGSAIPYGYNIGWGNVAFEEKTRIKQEETAEDYSVILDRVYVAVPSLFKANDWFRIRWLLEMLSCLQKDKLADPVGPKVAKILNLFCEQWKFYQQPIATLLSN